MRSIFNADEVFEMAEQIERNGAKFYRKVAEGIPESSTHQLLIMLAEMEDEHEKTFATIREDMLKQGQVSTVSPVFDPDNQATLYLKAIADGRVFDIRVDTSERLTGKETMEEVLQTAIGLEKDSIVFYLGIKEFVPEKLGADKIEDIIKEEMAHITYLNKELAALD